MGWLVLPVYSIGVIISFIIASVYIRRFLSKYEVDSQLAKHQTILIEDFSINVLVFVWPISLIIISIVLFVSLIRKMFIFLFRNGYKNFVQSIANKINPQKETIIEAGDDPYRKVVKKDVVVN